MRRWADAWAGTGERTPTNSKCQTTKIENHKRESEWQPVGETANSETMVAVRTRLQRACPQQRVSTMTLLLAPRQLGSQGGSSSTLSQSNSTRDLARFTRPRARTCHPPHPASHLWVLCLHPSYQSSLLPLTEVWTQTVSTRPNDWPVYNRRRPVETLVGPSCTDRQVVN